MGAAPTKACLVGPSASRSSTHARSFRAGALICAIVLLFVVHARIADAAAYRRHGIVPDRASSLWAVQVEPGREGSFDRAVWNRLQSNGVNALLLDVERLGSSTAAVQTFETARAFAARQKMLFVPVIPKDGRTSPAIWYALKVCEGRTSGLRCAVKAPSLVAAKAMAQVSDSVRPLVAVYTYGPTAITQFGSVGSARRPVLLITPLHGSFDISAWAAAIGQAATSSSVDLAVLPQALRSSRSARQFGSTLARFGNTLAARGTLAAVERDASTVPRLWAVQIAPGRNSLFDGAAVQTLRKDGVNALVLNVQALGTSASAIHTLEAVRSFAVRQKMQLVAVVPHSRWVAPVLAHVLAGCAHGSAALRCALLAPSVASAERLAGASDHVRTLVAVYVSGPGCVVGPSVVPLRRCVPFS